MDVPQADRSPIMLDSRERKRRRGPARSSSCLDIVGFLRKELRFFGLPMIVKMIVVPFIQNYGCQFPSLIKRTKRTKESERKFRILASNSGKGKNKVHIRNEHLYHREDRKIQRNCSTERNRGENVVFFWGGGKHKAIYNPNGGWTRKTPHPP